jgi:hypothetical protein
MSNRRAECECGALAVTCTGEPLRVSVCHCLACKRSTGSAFSYNARWREADVRIEGEGASFTRIGDEGGACTQTFCTKCGTTLYYRIGDAPDVIAVRAGAFADPHFPPPTVSVYHDDSRKHAWVKIETSPLEEF